MHWRRTRKRVSNYRIVQALGIIALMTRKEPVSKPYSALIIFVRYFSQFWRIQ
jgi:hypothetical protein